MSTLDTGLTLIRTASRRVSAANSWMGNAFKGWMPTGLYARALLIMIVPMVVLQSVVTFVFMERHWNTVTRHLSAAVVQDIASLIDVYQSYPQDKDRAQIRRIAQQRLQLKVLQQKVLTTIATATTVTAIVTRAIKMVRSQNVKMRTAIKPIQQQ